MPCPKSDTTLTAKEIRDRLADAESRLADLSRQVEHLQRLATIGTTAAGIVHEINNQLTPALAHAQMARLTPDDPARLRNAIDQCIHSINRASRIADTLVGFAAPRADESDRGLAASANVAQAVKSALACLGASRVRAAAAVELHVPPSAWVSIDPLSLQQILVNLLLNSITALERTQKPFIRIAASRIDQHKFVVSLEDNGPGIPEVMRSKLFQPFSSAAVTKTSRKGTGLGLAMCRQLIEDAGGTIQGGESEWGGAKFTLKLPAITKTSHAMSA